MNAAGHNRQRNARLALLFGFLICGWSIQGAEKQSSLVPADASEESEDEDKGGAATYLPPVLVLAGPDQLDPQIREERLRWNNFIRLAGLSFGWPQAGSDFTLAPYRHAVRTSKSPVVAFVRSGRQLNVQPGTTIGEALELSSSVNSHPLVETGGPRLLGLPAVITIDSAPWPHPFGPGDTLSALPGRVVDRIEVAPSAGQLWGDGALGGVLQINAYVPLCLPAYETKELSGGYTMERRLILPYGEAAFSYGTFGTITGSSRTTIPSKHGVLQLTGNFFDTRGFVPIVASERGPIDRPASSQSFWLDARWRQPLGAGAEVLASATLFGNSQNGGTTQNSSSTRGVLNALRFASSGSAQHAWNALLYAQFTDFDSSFSVPHRGRDYETLVYSEQNSPGLSFGGTANDVWQFAGGGRLQIGADAGYSAGRASIHLLQTKSGEPVLLTMRGAKLTAGTFASVEKSLGGKLSVTASARADHWSEISGAARATDGKPLLRILTDLGRRRSGTELNPSLGLVRKLNERWLWRINAQRTFRVPTLVERYRLAGESGSVLLPSSELATARSTNLSSGLEAVLLPRLRYRSLWELQSRALAEPAEPRLRFRIEAFRNEVRGLTDSVNADLTDGAADAANLFASGIPVRARISIDKVVIEGFRSQLDWRPAKWIKMDLSLSATRSSMEDSKILAYRGKVLRNLPGLRLAQKTTLTISSRTEAEAEIQVSGQSYANNENSSRVGSHLSANLALVHRLSEKDRLFFRVTNLLNSHAVEYRDLEGVGYTSSPVRIDAGLSRLW